MTVFKDESGLNPTKPKTPQAERDELMRKFLEKGGKIQKAKPGYPKNAKGLNLSWTREEVLSGKKGSSSIPDYASPNKDHGSGKIDEKDIYDRKDRKIWF